MRILIEGELVQSNVIGCWTYTGNGTIFGGQQRFAIDTAANKVFGQTDGGGCVVFFLLEKKAPKTMHILIDVPQD